MKLLNHFYQVGGPSVSLPIDATCYLIGAQDDLWLIDCGTPQGFEKICANIRKTGHCCENVKGILGTHGHYDHVGAAAMFKEKFGTKFWLHENDVRQMEEGDGIKTTAALLYGATCPTCKVDYYLHDGDVFEFGDIRLSVLHTPGHTLGSVCFDMQADGLSILIAGDTIWGGYSKKIGSDEVLWEKSLKRITGMHFDHFTFGHINPQLIADADTRLKEAAASFNIYYTPWFKSFDRTFCY